MSFSVLMSLYDGEKNNFLNACLQSLWSQTLIPDQIVIVYDGPIKKDLKDVVDKWSHKLNITIVKLDTCSGLGNALNTGLEFCEHELICRMDTDDICRADRFEKIIQLLESDIELILVGSYVAEFDSEPLSYHAMRTVPQNHYDILKYAKRRNPFNHMSVAFRKTNIISAGGYKNEFLYEDYALWVRVLSSGWKTQNIPDYLVFARVGNNMEVKRGGTKYAISEIKAQYGFKKIGFITWLEMCTNILIRVPVRLIPNWLRRMVYRNLLRR